MNVRAIAIYITIVFVPIKANAQSFNDSEFGCGKTESYVAKKCWASSLDNADKKLNTEYDKIYRLLRDHGRPLDAENVKSSENKWILFRDSFCLAERNLFAGGTAAETSSVSCPTILTIEHSTDLERSYGWMLRKFENPTGK